MFKLRIPFWIILRDDGIRPMGAVKDSFLEKKKNEKRKMKKKRKEERKKGLLQFAERWS